MKVNRKRNLRRRLFAQQNGLCHLCGDLMTLLEGPVLSAPHETAATFDHIVPRSSGGGFGLSNLKLAHAKCNQARADRPLIQGELRANGD